MNEPKTSDLPFSPEYINWAIQSVIELQQESTGLTFVPDVLAQLPTFAHEPGRQALLAAARQGSIELRPDAGLGRFTALELEVCPPGPDGSRLMWARIL